jgi:hypothetical protein
MAKWFSDEELKRYEEQYRADDERAQRDEISQLRKRVAELEAAQKGERHTWPQVADVIRQALSTSSLTRSFDLSPSDVNFITGALYAALLDKLPTLCENATSTTTHEGTPR